MHSFVRCIEPVAETVIHWLYIVAQNQISYSKGLHLCALQ